MSESQPIPKVVSFDCAQTLLEVDWSVKRYIADLAAHISLELPLEGPAKYEELYNSRLRDYVRVNMTRDHDQCDAWWLQLGQDWLNDLGLDPSNAYRLQETSWRIGFGPESILFKRYDDVSDCLAILKEKGIRVAVLSNWDYSLHRALQGADLFNPFELVVASLEHGVEKPDPRLFQVILDHFQVDASEVLHIGDNPIDDLEGARGAGMRAAIIDRSFSSTQEPTLHSLRNIEEAFGWSG